MKKPTIAKAIVLSFLLSAATFHLNAQTHIQWQKALGGSDYDGNSFGRIFPLHDGNYLLVGQTFSTDGNFSSTVIRGGADAFVMKIKSNGNVIWVKTYGGTAEDNFNSVVENPDHTLIVAGGTYSNDGDVSGNHGDEDAWVVKLSANGHLLSQHCYGGTSEEWITEIVRTNNNKYAFTGWSYSSNGDLSSCYGDNDVWVGLINQNTTLAWSKSFGGSAGEIGVGIFSTTNNKLIVSGITSSTSGDFQNYRGGDSDALAFALDYSGNILWSKCYGGSNSDFSGFHSGIAKDGNLLISGTTYSNDGNVFGNHGGADFWITKINNSNGNVVWSKCMGNSQYDFGYGIMTMPNGDLIALGITGPDDEFFGNINTDAKVICMDKNGNHKWTNTLGGSDLDELEAGVAMDNESVLLLGLTYSADAGAKKYHGDKDLWLVKLDGNCHQHREGQLRDINSELSVYPNPATNFITVNIPSVEKGEIQIANIYGEILYSEMNTSDQIQIDVNKFSAGIYIIGWTDGEKVESKKFSIIK